MIEPITRHSITRAAEEAVKLWALASTEYPKQHDAICDLAAVIIIETVSTFALNARRAMEVLPTSQKFQLDQKRWRSPLNGAEVVSDLWESLNRIIHAQKLDALFADITAEQAIIPAGSLGVTYVQAATDRKTLALIDPFALSHAFLYGALPQLVALEQTSRKGVQ
jgi:uncharacterized protein (DUF1778 family)